MPTIVAFDMGTTHLKWIVTDSETQRPLSRGQKDISPVNRGHTSEQDPHKIIGMIDDIRKATRQQFGAISCTTLSSAMHSLIAVDAKGQALTGSLTWMDSRARHVAYQLRESGEASYWRQLTGVPVHSMSPFVKWLWLKDQLPGDAWPVSLKDYIVFHLTGQWLEDFSTASASGFLGVDNQWLPAAVERAQLSMEKFPCLTAMSHRTEDLEGGAVIVGGSDAAMAHRHLRIAPDGRVAVLAMGTSGALRVSWEHPVDESTLFCYSMGPDEGFLVGSAFSNVGNMLEWLAKLFSVPLQRLVVDGIAAIRSGHALPLAITTAFGERSPWWREDLKASFVDVDPDHTPGDWMGAALLSLAASYAQGLTTLRQMGARSLQLRAGSGLMRIPGMAQWMADALGQDIDVQEQEDASLLGALGLARGRPEPGPLDLVQRFTPQDLYLKSRVDDTGDAMRKWVDIWVQQKPRQCCLDGTPDAEGSTRNL